MKDTKSELLSEILDDNDEMMKIGEVTKADNNIVIRVVCPCCGKTFNIEARK